MRSTNYLLANKALGEFNIYIKDVNGKVIRIETRDKNNKLISCWERSNENAILTIKEVPDDSH